VIAEILHAGGCTPATVVRVLRAEHVDAAELVPLLPTIGVPMDHAIRILHDGWDMPRHQAAEQLGATAVEMRSAGCSPAEIMAVRPREVLRALPDDPEIWASAALTMVDGGHPTPVIVSHLVAHAPTTSSFATAVVAVAEDPVEGIAVAVRYGAQADHLAATADAYDLEPPQALAVLTDAGATQQVTVEALHRLCDHDLDHTTTVTAGALGLDHHQIADLLDHTGGPVLPIPAAVTTTASADSLLDHIPPPEPSPPGGGAADSLLAMLPDPDPAGGADQIPETTR
jgi:hypothetical protein